MLRNSCCVYYDLVDVLIAAAMKSGVAKTLGEIASLLYWGMLAACTVGPGTVVTCARAGAEQGLNLAWVLIFATILAYILTVSGHEITA